MMFWSSVDFLRLCLIYVLMLHVTPSRNSGWKHGPSPAEIAATINAAKQASAQVLIAQQQVQAAKDNVLNQQKVANEKEASAAYASQKSEAAAAVQRSEAAAAAQAVVLAQHRLAAAKANVAHHQRIAAAKESLAAQAIQSSAKAAAAEIHRSGRPMFLILINAI